MKRLTPDEQRQQIQTLLNNGKSLALTDEENTEFPKRPDYWMAKISERTGVPLSSGRVAHDPVNKRIIVVD